MNILLELKGGLAKFLKNPPDSNIIEVNILHNSKITDVIDQLSIPKEYIALVTINKKTSGLNSELNDNDRVVFYPPIGGG